MSMREGVAESWDNVEHLLSIDRQTLKVKAKVAPFIHVNDNLILKLFLSKHN